MEPQSRAVDTLMANLQVNPELGGRVAIEQAALSLHDDEVLCTQPPRGPTPF